jgi:iron complex outermembrane receptor protein
VNSGRFRTTKMLGTAMGITALAFLTAMSASAQQETSGEQAPEEESSRILQAVVVTAQKKEENLQDVGVSVTAYSGEQLQVLGFVNSSDLIVQTPGLQASGFGGGAIQSFSIRGVGQNDFAAHQEAPIALYVDEVYQISNVSTRFSLFDVERAEVLRGPQGTLFGRNSTGGLVHYITAKPTQDYEGFVDVTLGEDGRKRFEAAVGGGIGEKAAFRLSILDFSSDGLIEQSTVANSRRDDVSAARGQLYLEPADDLSILLKAQYGQEDGAPNGYSYAAAEGFPTNFFGFSDPDGDPFTGVEDFASKKVNTTSDFTATVKWDLADGVGLTSVTNFQDIEDNYSEDADVSPDSLFNYEQFAEIQQFSQEIRINFSGDRHDTVAGVYYLDANGDFRVEQSGDVFFGPGVVLGIDFTLDTVAYALFAQTDYAISDNLSLTLGGRFNSDEKNYSLLSPDFGFAGYTDSTKAEEFTWKAQLDYDVSDDFLIYAGISRGTKSGGFNVPLTPVTSAGLKFDGETLTAYEVGLKAEFGNYTRLNTSVFHYDYEDYQAFNIDPFFNSLLFNAAAKMSGGEVEFVTSPVEGFDLQLGASYIDTEVTGIPATLIPSGTARPPLTPELTYNGLVRYEHPAFGGTLAGQLDFNWKDDHTFNLVTSAAVMQDSYGLLNARLSYTSGGGAWSVAVFAKNLADQEYRSFAVDSTAFFGSNEDILGEPRWFGANIRFEF